jgi:hypothetical protein
MPDRSHPADGVRRYRPAGDAVGYAVRTEHVRITMDDGARLAATLYVPDGPGPFPTVLESILYRKDDWTLSRDWPLHGAFAAAGYVSCRLAGPGDPGGGDRLSECGGLVFATDARYRVTVADGFADCRAAGTIRYRLAYPHGPEVVADAGMTLDSDRDELRIRVTLAVTEDGGPVFDRTWELAVPRDLL